MKSGFFPESLNPSADQHEEALDQRVRREQADSLLSTSMTASFGAFMTALGFWTIFYYQTRQPGVLVWAALLHARKPIVSSATGATS